MQTTLKIMDRTGHTTAEVTSMEEFEQAIQNVPGEPLLFDAKSKEQIDKDSVATREEVVVVPAFQGG